MGCVAKWPSERGGGTWNRVNRRKALVEIVSLRMKKKRKKERRKTASLVASWRVQWKDRIAELGTNRLLAYARCIVEKGWCEGGRVFYYLMERGTIDLVHSYTQRRCSNFCEKSRNLIVLRLLLFCVIKSLDVILEKKDMILVKKKMEK